MGIGIHLKMLFAISMIILPNMDQKLIFRRPACATNSFKLTYMDTREVYFSAP